MKRIAVMIKPASALCNMRCKYCFYANVSDLRQVQSYGIMSQDTVKAVLKNIRTDLERGDQITFAFQGGEPTLAGLEYFRYFVFQVKKWQREIKAFFALQTNGLSLNDEWCEFLHQNNFLVGISLDLLPLWHDDLRVDEKGNGTFNRVMEGINLLKKHQVEYNILCTLTESIARHPQKAWKAILKYDFKWVQFTPCLDELDHVGGNPYALKPEWFASFYIQLFSCWYQDFQRGDYRSIKLFDDIVNYLTDGFPTACGMGGKCQPQLIIEADGSAYPCDFYCLDEFRLGDFKELTLKKMFQLSLDSPSKKSATGALCQGCSFWKFCGGGCKRMRREVCYTDAEKKCGMQTFLQYCMKDFTDIAKLQIDYRK